MTDHTVEQLSDARFSIDAVAQMYSDGRVTEDVALAYTAEWHAGPTLCCAGLRDGAIRVSYHERKSPFCPAGNACKGG